LIVAALALAVVLGQAPEPPRRFALVVGVNQGESGEIPLRWAEEDARRMLAVLHEIGGVRNGDGFSALGVDAPQLAARLASFEEQLRHARREDQLIVYVSSHADQEALHLKGTLFPMRQLVDFIRRVPVGLALLVLDACQSGAATRLKGLKPREEGSVGLVPDVNGRIIISAASPFEPAQESDALQGSFFTQHLLAALRGAADVSRDGRITLDEAYRYAFSRTMESTLVTRGGIQHPHFWFELRGQGEVVLTEPLRASARITLAVDEPGEWLITSAEKGVPFGRVVKERGPLELAVPPGSYRLRTRRGDSAAEAVAIVGPREVRIISDAELSRQPLALARGKGLGPPMTLWLSAGPSIGSGAALPSHLLMGGGLGLRLEQPRLLGPFNLFAVSAAFRDDVLTSPDRPAERAWSARLGLGFTTTWDQVQLQLALEGGGSYVTQYRLPGGARSGLIPHLGASAGIGLPLFSSISLRLRLAGGATLVESSSGRRVTPYGELGLAAELPFPFSPAGG
jgi:hypothetical protein